MQPTIAESHEHADHAHLPISGRPSMMLIGRICLATIFLISGIAKLTDLPGTVEHMTAAGIPQAHTLAIVAGVAEICGGLAILFGFLTRLGAMGLVLFMIPTTIMFHNFWALEGAAQKAQMVNFFKNLCITGGLLMVAAVGAGRYSLDAKLRHRGRHLDR
ncbi:MAG: DoxX family protein [Kofleriaceae bacterium]